MCAKVTSRACWSGAPLRSIRNLNLNVKLSEAVSRQIDFFSDILPELPGNREDIINLVNVEEERYWETLERGKGLVQKLGKDLKKGQKLSLEKLIELYDSHGPQPRDR